MNCIKISTAPAVLGRRFSTVRGDFVELCSASATIFYNIDRNLLAQIEADLKSRKFADEL